MASTIKLKNGSGAPLAGDLVQGEPALDLTNKRLYTEDSGGNVIEVGTNPAAEITANGGIALPDNQKATFGASDDLQLYHSGSHSYIIDNGTGDLKIYGANIEIGNASGVKNLFAISGGATTLYNNNSAKLATTSTGVDVTGTVTADGLTVDTTTALVADFNSTDTAPKITVSRNGTERAGIQANVSTSTVTALNTLDNYIIQTGSTTRLSIDSGGLTVNGSTVISGTGPNFTLSETDTTDVNTYLNNGGGSFNIQTVNDARNSFTKRFTAQHSTGDISFYDSAGSSQSFYWDASAESLGIGTTSPARSLHVNSGTTDVTALFESSDANNWMSMWDGTGGVSIRNVSGSMGFYSGGTSSSGGDGSERMRIDSSGNVGIGTTSPQESIHTTGNIRFGDTAPAEIYTNSSELRLGVDRNDDNVASDITFYVNNSEKARIDSSGNVDIGGTGVTTKKITVAGGIGTQNGTAADPTLSFYGDADTGLFRAAVDTLGFSTGGSERMRIDSSGNLLVGTTSSIPSTGGFSFLTGAVDYAFFSHDTGVASGNYYIGFRYGNTNIGTITQNGTTGVLYNTSSDQRLKENIVDAPSASDDIDAIQVRSFDWKADGSHQKYGMIAQELMTVAPEAVATPEDPEEMMGVDYSKLVPMLIKEIQSLRARVAQLETN